MVAVMTTIAATDTTTIGAAGITTVARDRIDLMDAQMAVGIRRGTDHWASAAE